MLIKIEHKDVSHLLGPSDSFRKTSGSRIKRHPNVKVGLSKANSASSNDQKYRYLILDCTQFF